jgi:hypothetical protein
VDRANELRRRSDGANDPAKPIWNDLERFGVSRGGGGN